MNMVSIYIISFFAIFVKNYFLFEIFLAFLPFLPLSVFGCGEYFFDDRG